MRWFLRVIVAATLTAFVLPMALAQTADYNKVVAQAKADLAAGHDAEALAGSQKAIQMDASRWEAYLVAGSALQNQKQFDPAIEGYSKALERAPEPKKAGVRSVLEQCMREKITAASSPAVSASSAGAQNENQASPIPPAARGADQQGPSYKDTVKWIQDNIKLAGTPASSDQKETVGQRYLHETENDSSRGLSYSIVIDGCNSLNITSTEESQIIVTKPVGSDRYSSTSVTLFKVPFSSVLGFIPDDNSKPKVGIVVKDGAASFSIASTTTSEDGPTTDNSPPEPLTTKNDGNLAFNYGVSVPFVYIPYAKPGSEDAPHHMAAALQHLLGICKNHPEEAPKSLF